MIQVIKRDGGLENFEKEKILRVVKAAGLDQAKAEKLANDVESWVKSRKHHALTTLMIRDKVAEELKNMDSYAYNLFVWYEKTKEDNGAIV